MDFIKIGILQSFAESPLQSNKFLLEALQLAIDEINNSGGVLGLPIKPIFEDGGHSPVTFREKVRKLIRKDKIKFIFGVWQHFDNLNTNYEIRKAIKKEVEAHEVLFWYSLPYEGLEESRYIFFTGDIINQRVEAMVEWMLTKKWTNLYLIGQNNLHSGISNKLLKTLVSKNKGKIVGETFLNNENRDFDHLENELKQSKPDIIVNTLLGISNENLFNALSKAQNVIKKIPIISANLEQTSQENLTLFSCSSYFPAYQNKINKEFIKNFRQKYGKTQPITSGDAMIYSQPFIWKQLLEKSGSTNIKKIRHQAVNETFELPQGIVRIKENFHLSKKMKIAKISAEKEFEIVWESETSIQPLPWVGYEHIDNRNLPLLKDILGNIPNLIPLGDMVEKEVNEKTKEYIKDKDHLKTMFDTMNEGIALNEMVFNNRGEMIDYRIAEVNNAFYKLAGIKNDNVIGKLATEIYGLPQKMITEFWKNHRNAKEVEYNEYHSPVTDKSFLVASSPFKENKFITSFVEITERLKVEEALRQSDLRYRKYFELGLLGMAMIKPDHQWIEFNQKLSEMLGYTPHALRQITWREITYKDDLKYDLKIFEEITSGKLDHKTWEKRFVHKAGHMIYTEISLTAVRKKDGKVDYLLTTIKDITELKDSTVALSESEEKLNALFKAMTDLVALYEVVKNKKDEIVNFKLIDCNNAFKDNINLGKNGMGKLITEFTQIGQPEHLNIYKKVAKSGKAQKFTIHFKSDNQYFMTSVVSPKKGQLAVMAKNITDLKYAQEELEHHKNNLQKLVEERTKELNSANHHLAKANKTLVNRKNKLEAALDQLKATQVQLIQSEKMASLGVLAAGVAHEINNPLNFIHGSVRLLELYIDDNLKGHKEKLTPILYGAKEGIKRTSNIVKSLNLYSRRDKSKNRKCDIHKVIDNCLIMLNNQIKNRIEIKKLYTHVNFNLSANEGKMHQIMLNLLANAVEAIAEKGTITILTKIRAQKLAVTVTDTGKGISSENISKIMDPFFTTKPPGKGTGLGLYLTNRLIAEHNGQLSVASTPGTGSSIKVLLPISK